MKLNSCNLILLLLITACSQNQHNKIDELSNNKNLSVPIIFKPDLISTKQIVFSPAVSGNLNEFYYVVSDSVFQVYEIKMYNFNGDSVCSLPISRGLKDYSPFITLDNRYMFFASYRSDKGEKVLNDNPDIWCSERTREGWSLPLNVGEIVNSEYGEGFISVAENGNLYFESNRPGGFGDWDIYMAEKTEDAYNSPINIGENINTALNESDPYISPDESYMIFGSYNREEGYGSSDLYISFRNDKGKFENPINLGNVINTQYLEHNPHVSPDGKYFFFSTDKPRTVNEKYKIADFDIYYMSSDFINELLTRDKNIL